MFSRRPLAAAISLLCATGFIGAGCTPSETSTARRIVTDVGLIAAGLAPIAADIDTVTGVPAAIAAQIKTYIKIVQTDAAEIAANLASPPTTAVESVITAVQSVASVIASIPLLSKYALIMQAAASLLPPLIAELGGTPLPTAPAMTPDKARKILVSPKFV